MQLGVRFPQFLENLIQPLGVHPRTLADLGQFFPVAVQFLDKVSLDLRLGENTHHIEQAVDGGSTAPDVGSPKVMIHLIEQMLQPQERPHFLIQRVFVDDGLFLGWEHGALKVRLVLRGVIFGVALFSNICRRKENGWD